MLKEKLTIDPDKSLRQSLNIMGQGGEKCLVVIGDQNQLIGTLSDGDIRRAVLEGMDLSSTIEKILNKSPAWLGENYKQEDVRHLLIEKRVSLVPILDARGQVTNILTWTDIFGDRLSRGNQEIGVPVVIMAGGKGTRLAPFTHVLPKPLVPINEKPVIEHIIERFRAYGVENFFLTVQFKSKLLRAFFEELEPEYTIQFVEESEPLGTAGGLKALRHVIESTFIVTNCDILIDLDYADLMEFHKESESAMTLVACSKNYVLPYGVCHLETSGHLQRIEEKPEYSFLVNSGLYVVNPEILDLIPDGESYDMNQLLSDACNARFTVSVYPIADHAWNDVGEWSEYQKTISLISPNQFSG